jgi:beta-1,4-N-acetylglucosaminyltransferase
LLAIAAAAAAAADTAALVLIAQGTASSASVVTIPRSREVGQSYITSVATTLYSLLYAFQTVATQRPQLVGGWICESPRSKLRTDSHGVLP